MISDIRLFDYNCRLLKFIDRDINDRVFSKSHYIIEDRDLWFSLKDYMGVPDFVVRVVDDEQDICDDDIELEIYNEEE